MTAPASLALFAPCDGCGEAAALPAPDAPHMTYCPACQTRQAKEEAARAMLEDFAAPIVGAWASFWLRAGLTLESLEEVGGLVDMSWANPDYAQRVRRARLYLLARAHPLPPVEAVTVPPQRVGVDFAALPLLTAFYPEDPRPGALPQPVFFDSTGKEARLMPGLDTLALTLPDGVRAVLYTGMEGQGPYTPNKYNPAGLRVPADLWPAFEVYMSGRDKWADLPGEVIQAKPPTPEAPTLARLTLPEVITAKEDGEGVRLLCDRAGQVFEYRTRPGVPYALTGRRSEAKTGKPYTLTLYPEDPTRAASFAVPCAVWEGDTWAGLCRLLGGEA